ncbi:LCP family protein [Planctomonas sp. JC2975]|nr:LCP family protein [Planctomonas sp. JC2975]
MTRRGWWLVVLNLIMPGSAQVLAGNRKLGRFGLVSTLILWAAAIVVLVMLLVKPTAVLGFFAQTLALWAVQIFAIGYAVLWVVLTLDTLRLVRLVRAKPSARAAIAAFAVVLLVGVSGTAAYGAVLAGSARGALSGIFSASASLPPSNGRYNIMLLGGDAGPGRDGMRPDSMSVVSIDANTGQAVSIGVPRDLDPVPFSDGSPMQKLYPDGYGYNDNCDVDVCQLNSIYTEVELYKSKLYPNATKNNSQPGIEAMRDALEGVTGLKIQYYVLIDMEGFSQLVDALGGVTIDVKQKLPIGGDENLVGVTGWIQPGVQHMNGYTAQWYARSRESTSDYDRMARQRELEDAILKQFTPLTIATKFQDIAKAGAQVVKTDIPQSSIGYFADLAEKTRTLQQQNLELVPPAVDPTDPNFDQIHSMVQKAVTPPTASPKP